MSKHASNKKAILDSRENPMQEWDTEPQDQGKPTDTAAADGHADGEVKLTDISDIVSKYAVVDKVFDENDDGDEDREDEVEAAADTDSADREEDEEDLDIFALPERPKIVFRRPDPREELHSNWSDTVGRAVHDIRASQLREASGDTGEPTFPVPESALIRQDQRKLIRSIGISVGLPIVGGALFALVLYMQKDVKPTDLWGWLATSTTQSATTQSTPTPNFAAHPEVRNTPGAQANAATSSSVPLPMSPETGMKRAVPPHAQNDDREAESTAPSRPSSSNPVYMARLTVSDAQGTALAPVPLSLAVAPGVPEQRLRIRISGLPEGARLSNGSDLGNGEWLLKDRDLEGLTMSLAPEFSGQITLLAEVIDDATHIQAAPSQMMAVNVAPDKMTVQPASAAAANAPQSFAEPDPSPARSEPEGPTTILPNNSPFSELRVEAPTPGMAPTPKVASLTPPSESEELNVDKPAATVNPETSERGGNGLIAKGDELMGNGDIAAARLFYQRALKQGDPRAATSLGKSYDPVIFEQLRVHGVLPDPSRAIEWYRRGADSGDETATGHMQTLSAWLKG